MQKIDEIVNWHALVEIIKRRDKRKELEKFLNILEDGFESLTLRLSNNVMNKPINPELLDLVMRENDYVIYYGDTPLKTPEGNDFVGVNPRILQHIIIELSLAGKIDLNSINAYTFYSLVVDRLNKNKDVLADRIDEVIKEDEFIKMKLKKNNHNRLINVSSFIDLLDDNDQILNFLFYGVSSILKSLNDLILEENIDSKDVITKSSDKLIGLIKNSYLSLSSIQKAFVQLFCTTHDAGIILPLLIVKAKINPSEYSNVLFAVHLNYFQQKDKRRTFSEIIKPYIKTNIVIPDWKNHKESFSKIHSKVLQAVEYLSYFNFDEKKPMNILELINTGESYNLEFKSSFRWDVRAGKKNSAIEHASLKTISAFLNSGGGVLLIGVEDNGNIIGIEIDKFDNDDKFLLHFWNKVKSSMGQEVAPCINTSLEKVNGKTFCHVKCLRSPSPVFLKQKGFDEEFYIRIGPSSASLEIREALKYISERFIEKDIT